jgi:methyl-accepting chemotaxis protein
MTSIRHRLTAVICGFSLLLCTLMGAAFWLSNETDRSMHTALSDRIIPLRELKAISDAYAVDIVDTSHKVRGGSMTSEQGALGIENSIKAINAAWERYLKMNLSEVEKDLVAQVAAQKMKTDIEVARLLGLIRSQEKPAIAAFNDNGLYPTIEPMTAVIDKLVAHQITAAEVDARNASAKADATQKAIWIALVFAVFFVAYAFRVVFLDVLRPLARLTRSVAEIGGGKLDSPVPDQRRRDEVGRMAGVIETLRHASRELRDMEAGRQAAAEEEIARKDTLLASIKALGDQVGAAVALVNRSAEGIGGTSAILRESASDTARRASSAEGSLHANTASIQSMAAAASEMSATIEEVAANGERILQSIEKMSAKAAVAGAQIEALNAAAAEATSAVELIESVAEKTNLLALNATIEAARAGEAGRGFAVVASEVKGLATQAAQATADIRDLIGSMHTTAGALQDAVSEVLGGVGDVRAVAAFVKTAVDEQSQSTIAISRGIEEAAQAASLILSDVETMSRSARETGDAAEGVATISQDLVEASTQLDLEMASFAERMKAA